MRGRAALARPAKGCRNLHAKAWLARNGSQVTEINDLSVNQHGRFRTWAARLAAKI
jgi:uncharacterized protein YfaT (DUF1175 family)